jgi:hypothetical protein
MTDHYPPSIAELLAIPHPTSLDAGSPNRRAGDRLRGLDATALFAPVSIGDADMAAACLAGLWLRFDFLDESHKISQEIETPTGSFWHAIMHRREGDFGNSKYWWRRVGQHPALVGDPFAFVDAVEARVIRNEGDAAALQAHQRREWESLFDHCCRHAAVSRET